MMTTQRRNTREGFTMMARHYQREKQRHYNMILPLLMCCLLNNKNSEEWGARAFIPPTLLPMRRRTFIRKDLFSVKLNDKNQKGNKKSDKKDEDNDRKEEDFTWIKGLSRWPLYPPKENQALLNRSSEERDRGGFIPIPLANLIDVEAILMMNGEETLDDSKELEMYTRRGLNETTTIAPSNITSTDTTSSPLAILPDVQDLANWDKLAGKLQKSVVDAGSGTSAAIGGTTDALLKEATSRIEYFITEASTAISPNAVKDLVQRAGRALSSQDAGELVKQATNLAREQGLNVSEAAERARQTTEYTSNLVKLANRLLQNGYARGETAKDALGEKDSESKALFSDFVTAKTISPSLKESFVAKAAELGSLCGAIYQETVPRTLGLGHSIVTNSTTEDVAWMVTDCLSSVQEFQEQNETSDVSVPLLVRTITIRGFDASDESIDRELLLNRICTATPEVLENGVIVHSGLMEIARAIYKNVKPYIDFTAPQHKLVLTGHSVGGALAILLLFLLVQDKGVEYVQEKVARVFSFGSPPVTAIPHDFYDGEVEEYLRSIDGFPEPESEMEPYRCDTLRAFGLPSSMVYGFVQPWDPIVRLFSDIDPLYPLLGDIGEDGVTVYASGPPRTLRLITRAIFEAWDGWPRFRDTFRATVNQNYTSVGVQHLLLPDSVRYLSDRFVAANINVPPVEHIVRISSKELLPGLEKNFPLDTFTISFVPTAIRAFIHHFYPAYGFPVVDFANKKLKRQAVSKKVNDREKADYRIVLDKAEDTLMDIAGTQQGGNEQKVIEDEARVSKAGWSAPKWLQSNGRKESE